MEEEEPQRELCFSVVLQTAVVVADHTRSLMIGEEYSLVMAVHTAVQEKVRMSSRQAEHMGLTVAAELALHTGLAVVVELVLRMG